MLVVRCSVPARATIEQEPNHVLKCKIELKELLYLVRDLAVYDANLFANPSIEVTDVSRENHRKKEQRMIELKNKYELV